MNFQDKVILLVDDEQNYLTMTKMALEGNGFTVITESNPLQALEYLKTNKVDLILLDYFMPELTGDEFVRQLRTFAPKTLVVLQTGYADENTPLELMKKSDVQAYFDKTSGIDNLVILLCSIFRICEKLN